MENRGPIKSKSTKVTPLPGGNLSQRNALRTLKCYDEVEAMLQKGVATSVIARFIQDDRGELQDTSVESLGARLRQWRQTMTPVEVLKQQNFAPVRRVLSDAIQKLEKGMNESVALNDLLRVQLERVQQGREQEISDNRLSAQTGREIQLAAEIIAAHAKIRVDLGLPALEMNPETNEIEASLDNFGEAGGAVRRVLADPASRRRVLGLVERVSSLANAGFTLPTSIAGEPINPVDTGPTYQKPSVLVDPSLKESAG